jgi:hypothetical protein
LFQECSSVAKAYGVCLSNGEPKLSTVLAVVASSPNLCCIAEAFHDKTRRKIDPYYITRHSIAVDLIVEALYERLTALQYNVSIGAEVPVKFGRLDVLLEQTSHGVQLCYSGHKIGIEVKTGLSLDLAQIFRYILDVDALILVRTRPGQVIAIRQAELLEPLSALLSAWISRARRLLTNDAPVCNHHRRDSEWQFLASLALEQDIVSFAKDLHKILNQVLDLAVRELQRLEKFPMEARTHE